jgi:hypothetical protein
LLQIDFIKCDRALYTSASRGLKGRGQFSKKVFIEKNQGKPGVLGFSLHNVMH